MGVENEPGKKLTISLLGTEKSARATVIGLLFSLGVLVAEIILEDYAAIYLTTFVQSVNNCLMYPDVTLETHSKSSYIIKRAIEYISIVTAFIAGVFLLVQNGSTEKTTDIAEIVIEFLSDIRVHVVISILIFIPLFISIVELTILSGLKKSTGQYPTEK